MRAFRNDLEVYRDGYPDVKDDVTLRLNLDFYMGRIVCVPDHMHIDAVHQKWFGCNELLEYGHSYIQWLFPIQEQGLNYRAHPLQKGELDYFLGHLDDLVPQNHFPALPARRRRHIDSDEDDDAAPSASAGQAGDSAAPSVPEPNTTTTLRERFVRSYALMMDFYGFRLCDNATGRVTKKDNHAWEIDNLQHSSHNYLRITRILKFLGELKWTAFQHSMLEAFEHEIYSTKALSNCRDSYERFWIGTIKDNVARGVIQARIDAYPPPPPSRWGSWPASTSSTDTAAATSTTAAAVETGPQDNDVDARRARMEANRAKANGQLVEGTKQEDEGKK